MEEFVSNLDALHHIQQTALRQLTYKKWVSYAELLPDGMAGNAFNYHLNYLVKHKLIEKSEKGYTLSSLGRLVIDAMSLNAKRFKLRPSTGVMLYLKNIKGETLLYKSNRQPLIGHLGLPFGKVRIGASFKASAERMILRRGMNPGDITELQYFGPLNICYEENEELVCQRTGQVWSGVYTGEFLGTKTANGESIWQNTSTITSEEINLKTPDQLNDITVMIN